MKNSDPTTSSSNGIPTHGEDNNIMVEDAVSKFTWELSRNGEAQQVNGAVLAVLVSVALCVFQ